MIDVKTSQIQGLEAIDESVQDERTFLPLLDQVQRHCGEEHPVHRVLGGRAYDRNNLFETLEHRGILSGIKTRENAATHSTGSPYRSECVRKRMQWGGYWMWALMTTYGMRWKVEGLFSSIKRIFGETVRATSTRGMLREVRMKLYGYNLLTAMVT